MNATFVSDNQAYEAWLREQCNVVEEGLDAKHEKMDSGPFAFLRATYFRWAKCIERICPQLGTAPTVLSVGDLHVENFGTWRDAEGRLVWGVNDFDEAAEMAYPFDLVRLATSVRLSPSPPDENHRCAVSILEGYRAGLGARCPTILEEKNIWLRPLVNCPDEKRRKFWDEITALPVAVDPERGAAESLLAAIPKDAGEPRLVTRQKGGGSLGRPRYVLIATWRGGRVAREAKALVPSGWDWAHGRGNAPSRCEELASGPYRAPDPFFATVNGYILRRIAPDSRKIDLDDIGGGLGLQILSAMGFDLGSIHAASPDAGKIPAHLDTLDSDWLHHAVKAAAAAVTADFEEWQAFRKS